MSTRVVSVLELALTPYSGSATQCTHSARTSRQDLQATRVFTASRLLFYFYRGVRSGGMHDG
eukprot:7245286-Prymnesium_polylepis.1